jgi:hypothetical protein
MNRDWLERPQTVYDWKRFVAAAGAGDPLYHDDVYYVDNGPYDVTFAVPSTWDIGNIEYHAERVRPINMLIRVVHVPW